MKTRMLLLLVLISFLSKAQKKISYLQSDMSLPADSKTEFKRETIRLADDSFEVNEYANEKLSLHGKITNVKDENMVNIFLTYYRTNLGIHNSYKINKSNISDVVGSFIVYKNGEKQREFMFKNDKVTISQIWNDDKTPCLLNGTGTECFFDKQREFMKLYSYYKDSLLVDSYAIRTIKNDTIYDKVDKQAMPKNGMSGFYEELLSILKYPIVSNFLGIGGKVFISFVVDEQGKLTDFEALDTGKGRYSSFENKTIKKLKLLSSWNPAMLNDKPVKTMFTIPVRYAP